MTKSVAHYLRKFYLFFQIKKLSLLFALFLREKLVFCVKFIIWKVSWKIWRFSAWGFLLTVEKVQTIPNIFEGVLYNFVLKDICLWLKNQELWWNKKIKSIDIMCHLLQTDLMFFEVITQSSLNSIIQIYNFYDIYCYTF